MNCEMFFAFWMSAIDWVCGVVYFEVSTPLAVAMSAGSAASHSCWAGAVPRYSSSATAPVRFFGECDSIMPSIGASTESCPKLGLISGKAKKPRSSALAPVKMVPIWSRPRTIIPACLFSSWVAPSCQVSPRNPEE